MKESWIIKESKKAKTEKNYVILENPKERRKLDDILLKTYWPKIQEHCNKTEYILPVEENKKTDFELSFDYSRSLTFLLFDEQSSFFRGKLSVSLNSWMLESELFLGLPKETEPEIIFGILGNSRFAGNPPKLYVYKNHQDYFQITFHNGSGKSWFGTRQNELTEKIFHSIDVNILLHKFVELEMINKDSIGEFITKAYQVYESY